NIVFAGSNRIRPILTIAVGEAFGVKLENLLPTACAIELIHTYSLIHDDLPALDNDDLRRGQPTCHKVFGEAMAILAGDALLTRCYQILTELPDVSGATRLAIVREISYATGTIDGMTGGQVVDVESEGKDIGPETLEYIHRAKTGALLAACAPSGGLAGAADTRAMEALSADGRRIGTAFQMLVDILDGTGRDK